jgi:stringent starvation protein B
MAKGDVTTKRPYLIRAMHEWMTDNGLTPHVVVEAGGEGILVPEEHVSDGKIVLNVSYSATRDLSITNEVLSFEARFGGVPQRVQVPTEAVQGIYARETGQGMIFTEEAQPPDSDSPAEGASPGRPELKIVK